MNSSRVSYKQQSSRVPLAGAPWPRWALSTWTSEVAEAGLKDVHSQEQIFYYNSPRRGSALAAPTTVTKAFQPLLIFSWIVCHWLCSPFRGRSFLLFL